MSSLGSVSKKQHFADLKQQLWCESESHMVGRLDLDVPALMNGTAGGLAMGRVHLMTGGPQDGAASGFVAALAHKLLQQHPDQALIWCLPVRPRCGQIFGAGLAAFGIDPGRVILVCESHPLRAIAACEEALSAQNVAAVICEYDALASKSDLWLKAARRLQLAAEQGHTTGIMLGPPAPAAGFESRWHLLPSAYAAPSARSSSGLSSGSSSGTRYMPAWLPCWQVELHHCRGGYPLKQVIIWDHRTGRFCLADSVGLPVGLPVGLSEESPCKSEAPLDPMAMDPMPMDPVTGQAAPAVSVMRRAG